MRLSLARLLVLSAICLAFASAQTPGAPPNGNLEFRILPEAGLRGMPRAFSFLLVNRTDHNVRIPVPTFMCSDAFSGSISLHVRFTPKVPGSGPSGASGCAGDRMNWPPITERIMEWRVVPAGYALILKIDPKNIVWHIAPSVDIASWNSDPEHTVQPGLRSYWYDDSQSGIYEFWATYSPPSVTRSDQTRLEQLGIDFPRAAGAASQSTDHVAFVKD